MKNPGLKILIWKEKHENVMVAARDEAEEARAWLYLFKLMEENDFYHQYDMGEDELAAYTDARCGSWKGARWLLELRSGGEYETVRVEYIVEP